MLSFLYDPALISIHNYRKIIALIIWTFTGKVMSLLFNILSRLVIAFLPRSKCLLISWLQSPSAVILEPKKIKCVTVSIVSHLFSMKWWDCKEIKPVHPKGDQSWIFIGSADAEAEAPILWLPDVKSQLTGRDLDGKDWRPKEKGTTEDELAGWHHWLDGRESEWTPGVGDGQGGLVCCDSWGRKESDTTERLN